MTNGAKTQGANSMERIAWHYANELDAKFRTLNNFVNQAGEVGRAHENYLREILSRFLPDNIRIGSGFIASPIWTSKQQDILIFHRDLTTLFQVGDCVVVDYDALVGTIEVKTNLDSIDKWIESLELIAEIEGRYHNNCRFRALYTWDGLDLETAKSAIWQFVEKDPNHNFSRLPNVIYVRGKYLLMEDEKVTRSQQPFSLWPIGDGGINEGQALLGFVKSIWVFGLSKLNPSLRVPWWLLSWHCYHGHLPGRGEPVVCPPNLM